MKGRLAWRIALAYVALIVAVTAGLGVYLAWSLRNTQIDRLLAHAADDARLIADAAGPALAADDGPTAQALAQRLAAPIGARVTLADPRGIVLGDSEADPAALANLAGRAEIAAVLAGAPLATSVGHAASVDRGLVYVAVPVIVGGRLVGVSRVSRNAADVDSEVTAAIGSTIVAVFLAGGLGVLLALPVARSVSQPIVRLTETARAMAAGDLERQSAAVGGADEVGDLARAFDEMARRIRGLVRQLESDRRRLRHAETVRREFVGNVSHELKTPIASIKALTETLEDGALDDPPAARDFLQRMHIEVDGMAQLVQELLDLSRIESGQATMSFAPHEPTDLIRAAAGRLAAQAERAGLNIVVRASSGLPAVRADGPRIEGAILNLLHNAIKFTPPGGRVEVRAESRAQSGRDVVWIAVFDTGIGVAPDELARLFERFWKADRSRASTGTGLGLAIVKHVVQAHDGDVGAESTLGRGSTFWFTLPLAASLTHVSPASECDNGGISDG